MLELFKELFSIIMVAILIGINIQGLTLVFKSIMKWKVKRFIKDEMMDSLLQSKFNEIKSKYKQLENIKLHTYHSKDKSETPGYLNPMIDAIVINTGFSSLEDSLGILGHELTHALVNKKTIHIDMVKYVQASFFSWFFKALFIIYSLVFVMSLTHELNRVEVESYKSEYFYFSTIVMISSFILSKIFSFYENSIMTFKSRGMARNHYVEYLCDQGSRILIGDNILEYFKKGESLESPSHPSDKNRVRKLETLYYKDMDKLLVDLKKIT